MLRDVEQLLRDLCRVAGRAFLPVEGVGLHRLWYTGGRWAYASALLDGFTDYVLVTIDLADPTHPRLAGRWWLPGMHQAAGETPDWDATRWRCSTKLPKLSRST